LQDAITAYVYVLESLYKRPEQFVMSGNSAGGNLALAVLRYLHISASPTSLPLPRAVLLWSP
jgi:acetyl esterase/lipase